MVLDGLRLAAAIVAADRAYVYVSDPESAHSIEGALSELGPDAFGGVTVDLITVQPGYVAGEETAAVRVLNGGPAKPTDKPPRPFEAGVGGRPTLVSNVETLANLPYLQSHGSAEFRSQGTELSPGTFLATITGAGRPPVLYELPHGLPFTELLALHGVSPDQVRGALLGGYLPVSSIATCWSHVGSRDVATARQRPFLRRDSVITSDSPLWLASVLAYFDRENAGQCGSCFNGTAAMAAVAGALRDGVATTEDVDRLRRWSVVLRGRGACATLDAATNVAASLLDQFPSDVARHLEGGCPDCRDHPFRFDRPYQAEAGSKHENPFGPHGLRRLRRLRQARARILLVGRLGLRVGDRGWHGGRRGPRRGQRALLDCPVTP